MAEPTKKEIAAVFKKLRNQGANKVVLAFWIIILYFIYLNLNGLCQFNFVVITWVCQCASLPLCIPSTRCVSTVTP